MPTRILRDCTDSYGVNTLTDSAEKFFYRLIQKADDYGRYHGDTKLIRPMVYPLQLDRVREADITRWIAECVNAGLIRQYEAGGKQVVEIIKFGQRVRAEKSKFPSSDGQSSVECQTAAPVVVVGVEAGDECAYVAPPASKRIEDEADDLPSAPAGEVMRLLGYVKDKFGLPPLDANTERIRANLGELLGRGFKPEQIEEVCRWAKAPHGKAGCPQSAVSATDPLKFGQWLTTMENHAAQLEIERKRRNR